ncbi:MAG TPA: hypothetical protein VF828_03240 [Patescibacteria group bacterium]
MLRRLRNFLIIFILIATVLISKNAREVLATDSCACDDNRNIIVNNCDPNAGWPEPVCFDHILGIGGKYGCQCQPKGTNNVGVTWPSVNQISVGSVAPIKMYCDSSGQPSQVMADANNPKIYTALGCIPVTETGFIGWLLPVLFGIVGGIAFLLMVYGFITIATSQGDPKAIQGGKETITSAVSGLLIAIFSLFILRLIFINILHIPGMQ